MDREVIDLTGGTEWGVDDGQGKITSCESEQAARRLAAESGGLLVRRRTWTTSWS
jgi:hypothetical protein